MDYSNGSSVDLNELALDESMNIGRGTSGGAYADWDNGGTQNGAAYAWNTHSQDASYGAGTIKDSNDWSRVGLPFARSYAGGNFGMSIGSQRIAPMTSRDAMRDQSTYLVKEESVLSRDGLPYGAIIPSGIRDLSNSSRLTKH